MAENGANTPLHARPSGRVLVVVGPTAEFADSEQQALDTYLTQGGRAMLLLSAAPPLAHCVSTPIAVDAETAFAFLSDGMNQSYWALGSWNRRLVSDGIYAGTSLFDGTELFVRVLPRHETLSVDFETGRSPDTLEHRVEARVIPGETLGRPPQTCVVTLTVWRSEDVDEPTWDLLGHSFATELQMIKGRLELAF